MKLALLGPALGVFAGLSCALVNVVTNNTVALWAFITAAWAAWAGYLTYEANKL